jgi:putative transport protein
VELDLKEVLSANWTLLLFVIIALGYLIAKIRLGGVPLGTTAGVLIAGLLFGHLGFPNVEGAATFGFTLFIFSVGLQAGPRFFSVFLEDGMRYIVLALVVAGTGIGLALTAARVIDLDYGMSAGLMAGALTSTPTLAGAQDALKSGLANLPEGMTAAQAASNVGAGYAITYLFGTIGLIITIRYVPKILRIDLPAEARRLAEERGLVHRERQRSGASIPIIRAYAVAEKDEAIGQTVAWIGERANQRVRVLQIRRGTTLLDTEPELILEAGDVVAVLGSLQDLAGVQDEVGQEVMDPELLNYQIATEEIVVTSDRMAGATLDQLKLISKYGCLPVAITRSGIDLPPEDGLLLEKGDRLVVSGEAKQLERLVESLGYVEKDVHETDLLTFASGIILGGLVGVVLVKIGELSVGLGSAGGLLLAGILIGYLRNLHPTFGGVPPAARWLLMELGLLIFMASVGLGAGAGIIDALKSVGIELFLAGVVVTLTPIFVAYAFGRIVYKMNPALLLGAVTGAMTSTPALGAISDAAKSPVPSLGYAGTYTFANVFLTFAGTLMMTL